MAQFRVSRCEDRFVWLGRLGSSRRSRPPDMGNGNPAFMSHVQRPALLESQGVVPQALTLSGEAKFITW